MTDSYLIVYCTCPSMESAEKLAEAIIAAGHAACVSMVPGIRSVYKWEGKIEKADEIMLLIKTTGVQFGALKTQILSLHPYELPEIVAVPICAGHEPYLSWIDKNTGK